VLAVNVRRIIGAELTGTESIVDVDDGDSDAVSYEHAQLRVAREVTKGVATALLKKSVKNTTPKLACDGGRGVTYRES
jgi:hypothetical protein